MTPPPRITCPLCGAAPGDRCRVAGTQRLAPATHRRRIEAALLRDARKDARRRRRT